MARFPTKVKAVFVVGALVWVGGAAAGAHADARQWKGAESFAPVAIGPNVARCGVFPTNLEAHFVGTGIDTNQGPYTVAASGCLDTVANVLSDVEATDTYLGSGDAVKIAAGKVALVVDPATCVASNATPRPFTVAGGTGSLAGASGGGVYDLAFTLPTCAKPQSPVFVWFRGDLGPSH